MARALPSIAVVLAVVAVMLALFRAPAPQVDPADLATIQQDVDGAIETLNTLSERVGRLERAAPTPGADLSAEVDAVRGDVDDLAAGLENACGAIRDLSSRIDDLAEAIDSSNVALPPSFGGRC